MNWKYLKRRISISIILKSNAKTKKMTSNNKSCLTKKHPCAHFQWNSHRNLKISANLLINPSFSRKNYTRLMKSAQHVYFFFEIVHLISSYLYFLLVFCSRIYAQNSRRQIISTINHAFLFHKRYHSRKILISHRTRNRWRNLKCFHPSSYCNAALANFL